MPVQGYGNIVIAAVRVSLHNDMRAFAQRAKNKIADACDANRFYRGRAAYLRDHAAVGRLVAQADYASIIDKRHTIPPLKRNPGADAHGYGHNT